MNQNETTHIDIKFNQRLALAELAARFPGTAEEAVEKTERFLNLVEEVLFEPKNREKHQLMPDVFATARIALEINDHNLGDREKVERALNIWRAAADLQNLRSEAATRRHRAQGDLMERSIDEYAHLPKYLVDAVADNDPDLRKVTTFERWMRVLMPLRRKIDRLERFMEYLGQSKQGPFAAEHSANEKLAALQVKFTDRRSNNAEVPGWLREETLYFKAWDRTKAKEDLSEKNRACAKKRWGKSS